MTPKACSLYDHIKLSKIKNGYSPRLDDMPCTIESESLKGLIAKRFVRIKKIHANNLERPFNVIEVLK